MGSFCPLQKTLYKTRFETLHGPLYGAVYVSTSNTTLTLTFTVSPRAPAEAGQQFPFPKNLRETTPQRNHPLSLTHLSLSLFTPTTSFISWLLLHLQYHTKTNRERERAIHTFDFSQQQNNPCNALRNGFHKALNHEASPYHLHAPLNLDHIHHPPLPTPPTASAASFHLATTFYPNEQGSRFFQMQIHFTPFIPSRIRPHIFLPSHNRQPRNDTRLLPFRYQPFQVPLHPPFLLPLASVAPCLQLSAPSQVAPETVNRR